MLDVMGAYHATCAEDKEPGPYGTVVCKYVRPERHPRAAAASTPAGLEMAGGVASNHGTTKNKKATLQAQGRSYVDDMILRGEHTDVARISSAPSNPML